MAPEDNPADQITEREYYAGMVASQEEQALRAERDKLLAFKNYVHARLDAAGVTADPESPHKAEGCRIGGRLDEVLALHALAADQAAWSQATFGSDESRGPIGALKHLEKEAREAQEAVNRFLRHASLLDTVAANAAELDVHEELADCLLLILDASRRAGLSPLQLIRAAQAKMVVNKARRWPTPKDDTPVEHVKENG